MKSRLVILDANVIIEAFRGDFWNPLIAQYQIHVTSIVLHGEALYYQDKKGQRVQIDLNSVVASGKVKEISASTKDVLDLEGRVNPTFMDRIDDGEKEALALLLSGAYSEFRFCTGDTRAIKALASLNLGAYGISLEELLVKIRLQNRLPHPSYRKDAFNKKIAEGLQEQSMFLKKEL